jgi:cytosine/uracil/thiamine/allantoin permease
MNRAVYIFGSILGVLLSINLVYTVHLCYTNPDFKPNMTLGYLVILVMLSMVFFAIKNHRDKQLNGTISLGRAFKTGALTAVVGSTIYVIVWLVTYYLFVPDFMDKYAEHELRNAISSGMSLPEIAKLKQQTETYKELYKSPFWVIVLTYLEILPLGLIVAFISALVLKRKTVSN